MGKYQRQNQGQLTYPNQDSWKPTYQPKGKGKDSKGKGKSKGKWNWSPPKGKSKGKVNSIVENDWSTWDGYSGWNDWNDDSSWWQNQPSAESNTGSENPSTTDQGVKKVRFAPDQNSGSSSGTFNRSQGQSAGQVNSVTMERRPFVMMVGSEIQSEVDQAIMLDSGSYIHVAPLSFADHVPLQEPEKWIQAHTATGDAITHFGDRDVSLITRSGEELLVRFHIMSVK